MVLSSILSAGNILSFLVGIGATSIALYKYVSSRISPQEAARIYEKAKAAVKEYENAKVKGDLTTAEKLKIAEDTIAVIQEVIKDLE